MLQISIGSSLNHRPLTPTLPLKGEGRAGLPGEQKQRRPFGVGRREVCPLPVGEGQGEGEHEVRSEASGGETGLVKT